ncbi:MAG: spore cortex biosynthesis protein YabQ [bacterium]|nr:spore cortex biosynthesis protein YabQ [bacterium]MCM1374471.1 spore cortex biosynthesis protein YabQ [Muribaculum sp.]
MSEENIFLLYAIASGIFITFIYDILRILRRAVPHGGFLISLEDLVFWVYCAIHIFQLMHRESNGSLRWFAVMGALAGMLLYKKTVSSLLVRYASMILGYVINLLLRLLGFCLRPVAKAGHAARGAVRRLRKRAWSSCKNRLKKTKRSLRMRLKK